jgi:hypothetical protein
MAGGREFSETLNSGKIEEETQTKSMAQVWRGFRSTSPVPHRVNLRSGSG